MMKENKTLHNSLLKLPRESEKQWRDNLNLHKKKLSNESSLKSSKGGENEDMLVKNYTSHPHDLWRIKQLEQELKKSSEKLNYFQIKLKNLSLGSNKINSPTLSSLQKSKSSHLNTSLGLNNSSNKNHYEEEINRLKDIINQKDEKIKNLFKKLTYSRAYPILSSDTSLAYLLQSNGTNDNNCIKKQSSMKSLNDQLNSMNFKDDVIINETNFSDDENNNMTEEERNEVEQEKRQRIKETLELQNNFILRQLNLRKNREIRFHPLYDEDIPSNNLKLMENSSKHKHISAIETAKKIFHTFEREYFEEFDDMPV